MKEKIFVLAMFFCFLSVLSFPAYAATVVDTSNLTESQKAELVLQAEKMKQEAAITSAQKVNEWVDVGKNIGMALTSSAKELGVAADTFLQSTAGKITVVFIFWKVMGRDLVHFIIGFLFFVVSITSWIYFFRRMCVIKSVNIEYPKEGLLKRIKHFDYYGEGDVDGTRWAMFVALIIVIITGALITFV
jgi:hypothetical protein